MSEEKQVNFDTIYETTPGIPGVVIRVQPESTTPNTIQANLLNLTGKRLTNNTGQLEGELMMIMKNTLYNIDFEIDDEGNLIVHAPDAENYSINSGGFLIYTYR